MSMFELLHSGDVFGFGIQTYTNVLGSYFYLAIALLVITMLYTKTQDVTMPAILSIMMAGAFGVLMPPEAGIPILMMLGLGVSAIIYKIFKSRS